MIFRDFKFKNKYRAINFFRPASVSDKEKKHGGYLEISYRKVYNRL